MAKNDKLIKAYELEQVKIQRSLETEETRHDLEANENYDVDAAEHVGWLKGNVSALEWAIRYLERDNE